MSGQDGAPRSAKRRKLRAESTDKEVEPNAEPKATLSASRNLRNGTTKRLRQGDPAYQNGDAVDTVGEVSKEEEGSKGVRTPRKGRNGKSAMTGQDGDVQMIDVGVDESIGLRSSDRQRKRPRRFSPEVEPTLNSRRGIPKTTTPRIKTPASVKQADEVGVSDAKIESIGKDLGFKDINGSSKKRQARRKATDNLEEEAILPLVTARIEEDTVQISDATEEVATPSKSKRKGRKPTSKQLPILEDLSEVTANLEELPVEEPELLDPAPIVEIAEPSIVREDVDDETVDAFDIIQKLVLAKLSGRRRTALIALDEEYKKVQHVAQQTVEAGEGNSMLIIGPRGSGKTTMIESVVSELMESQKDDFHIVRLSGFLQTDDRLALREIWRQLGREMDVEDDANKVSSYADTMASLLALLSHPEEHSDTLDADVTTKSIIFIIDEFDLFATHPRQTLLYNLFDIAQSRKAPIAVFGLSTKVDVAEHLEKRVKSRFSHRYVYLPLAKSLPMFTEMCMSALRVHDRDLEGDHSDVLIGAQTVWNSHVEVN
ncbi:putative origin recognition complex subunit [Phaeomoniella chlamydospora]|uniref:Origin recognition complex subunit 4 n=1 Tax=Phaeomoniella chlamydospora TaxID=158046 RepID=A0A0G2EMX3_PHACM|nr:putative origin recognition complex subunit [Phaeomoniella chlamydospora]